MDFYEELGVLPTASEAELRASYKRLTLLLHPDQHQKVELRSLAETQMKRINEIIELLTNPERRRVYDERLHENTLIVRHELPPRWSQRIRNNRGWVLVGLALAAVLISVLLVPRIDSAGFAAKIPGSPSLQTPEKPRPYPTQATLPKPGHDKPRSDFDRKPALGVPAPAAASNDSTVLEAKIAPLSHATTPDGRVPKLLSEALQQTAPSVPEAAPTLAGRWVYTPDPSDAVDPKLFRSEYVELSILLDGHTLRGAYQSRYKLSDHRLNSNVNFRFEGPASTTSFSWQGDSGAQGEITIRLEQADTLKVNWFATAMGSALSLGSGSATLYRFR